MIILPTVTKRWVKSTVEVQRWARRDLKSRSDKGCIRTRAEFSVPYLRATEQPSEWQARVLSSGSWDFAVADPSVPAVKLGRKVRTYLSLLSRQSTFIFIWTALVSTRQGAGSPEGQSRPWRWGRGPCWSLHWKGGFGLRGCDKNPLPTVVTASDTRESRRASPGL